MSKGHRSSGDSIDSTESATLISGGGSSGAPMPAPSVPVQETNILQILEQHLPKEHAAVVAKITSMEGEMTAAVKYREQLERIAGDAGVTLSPQG